MKRLYAIILIVAFMVTACSENKKINIMLKPDDLKEEHSENLEKLLDEEKKWMEDIGAENVEHISSLFFCTIDEKNLSKFEDGKCHYNIIKAPVYTESLEGKTIEDFYGTYECQGLVFMPGEVGWPIEDTSIGSELTICDSELLIKKGNEVIESIKEPVYTRETKKDSFVNSYGFEKYNFVMLSQELYEFFLGEHMIINASGKHKAARVFICEDTIYVDRGLQGVCKYKIK